VFSLKISKFTVVYDDKKAIVLFDGVCNLCNASVIFTIKRDSKNNFMFASLQSAAGKQLAEKYGIPSSFNSFVLIDNGAAYTQSTAALRVLKKTKGLWPLLYGFIMIPAPIRNLVYKFISRNRYRFFGKRETCIAPNAELKSKFLE
jgi:predicted DCC family thiol-disulfide oxidoreductase YuxK